MTSFKPHSIEEVQEIIRAGGVYLPRGGGSKPSLSTAPASANSLEMSGLSGIIEYDPGEYTFTAYAGTAVAEVATALAEHGQYMPFDPLLTERGATLGGTVAANTAGSGRYRFGGLRDFILGVRFVDGAGKLVRSGGKVVKNAAGFDLSKFMVGSLGRYGVMVELSFKVFPRPAVYSTIKLLYSSTAAALQATFRLAVTAFEMDAVDLEPCVEGQCALIIRVGGLKDSLTPRIERLRAFLASETSPLSSTTIEGEAELALWRGINNLEWADDGTLVKVPLSPRQLVELDSAIPDSKRRYTCAGNVAWVCANDLLKLTAALDKLHLAGLKLTGDPTQAIIGSPSGLVLARRVKQALDPAAVFGEV